MLAPLSRAARCGCCSWQASSPSITHARARGGRNELARRKRRVSVTRGASRGGRHFSMSPRAAACSSQRRVGKPQSAMCESRKGCSGRDHRSPRPHASSRRPLPAATVQVPTIHAPHFITHNRNNEISERQFSRCPDRCALRSLNRACVRHYQVGGDDEAHESPSIRTVRMPRYQEQSVRGVVNYRGLPRSRALRRITVTDHLAVRGQSQP